MFLFKRVKYFGLFSQNVPFPGSVFFSGGVGLAGMKKTRQGRQQVTTGKAGEGVALLSGSLQNLPGVESRCLRLWVSE